MNEELFDIAKIELEENIEKLNEKLADIKAGGINLNKLSKVLVTYYGAKTPLNQLANISSKDAREVIIKPFDKKILGDIEKEIFAANLGYTPINNGEIIIISIPPVTEELRLTYVKDIKVLGEKYKINVRNIRQDLNNKIKKSELAEDLKKNQLEDSQDLIEIYNKKIDKIIEEKEKSILTI